MLVFGLGALAAMTYGQLKRFGMDPLAPDTVDSAPADDCEYEHFQGRCELEGLTRLTPQGGQQRIRATYRLEGSDDRVDRIVRDTVAIDLLENNLTSDPIVECEGDRSIGACPPRAFVFENASGDQ